MVSLDKLLLVTPANSIQASVVSQAIKLAKSHHSHITFFSVVEELPKDLLVMGTICRTGIIPVPLSL
ncbi:hypothetical protein [Colwellia sp. C1TZA3]|uniref:hypothetical protein n=1 Tax=Colwellia sp. C1TZA3 TaxID=2508879 RepID=UPI0011B94F18|nr:hypothetical protein [Colwellia sp. C1TZA3]TWX69099.1 hypothetical protein ESZ39_11680 [Colwellia sp. C1TZA3]